MVRPKTGTASTPRDGKDNVVVGQEFLIEMRDFMRQQQRNEKILFDLKTTIFQKPRNEWGSEEQVSQNTHHPLPTPRTYPPPLRGTIHSTQAHPVVDSIQAISQSPAVPYRRYHEPRIPEFIEGEDVESFFIRFERIAKTWGWLTDEWVARVVTLLTGKALEAYAGMDEQRSGSYEDIKAAVLVKYNVTEETYRQCFRSLTVPSGECQRDL